MRFRPSVNHRPTLVLSLTIAVVANACIGVETVNNPALPGPDWRLYTDAAVGLAVALPPSWHGFDLRTQIALAADTCSTAQATQREAHRARMQALKDQGVSFYACDSRQTPNPLSPFAYAVRGRAPSVSLETYLAGLPQAPGRRALEAHVEQTAGGELAIQKVSWTVDAAGARHEWMQWQYLTVRYGQLHGLFIEFDGSNAEDIRANVEKFGRSFTPLR